MSDDSHEEPGLEVREMENQELAKEYEEIEQHMAHIIDEIRFRTEGNGYTEGELPELPGEFSDDRLVYRHSFNLL